MKKLILFLSSIGLMAMQPEGTPTSIHTLKAKTLDGADFNFASLKGKKILIVNTASECGYTPQYKDLETLYEKYKDKNFVIIGFPCNDFGGQEPGTATEIKSFCSKNYGVTFQMMEKVSTKGDQISPIYSWLCSKEKNGVLDVSVKWNFGKFLINEEGNLVNYFSSGTKPMSDEIVNWIEGKKTK